MASLSTSPAELGLAGAFHLLQQRIVSQQNIGAAAGGTASHVAAVFYESLRNELLVEFLE